MPSNTPQPAHSTRYNNQLSPGNGYKVLIAATGLVLVLCGCIASSMTILGFLRPEEMDWSEKLLQGTTFFRIGLVTLGLAMVISAWLPCWNSVPNNGNDHQAEISITQAWILAILLATAAAMRFYSLNQGLWFDEILTHVNYAHLPFGTLITTYSSENQHFLYSILASFSYSFFGESAWALRLPALTFGVASLAALFFFGRLVSNDREAFLATALLTFSYHHVWFSQNARGYTGLLFWTILASWLFLRGLRKDQPKVWIYYAVAAALGVYTHLTMLFVMFGHGTIYLIELFRRRNETWPTRWVGIFFGLALAGLLSLFLYSLVLPQMLDRAAASKSVVEAWKNPLWTLLEFKRGLQIGFSSSIVVIIALILFVAGLWRYLKEEYAVVLLLFVPSIVGAAVTIAVGHHLWPRFFFFTFGFGALVVVKGVMVAAEIAVRLLLRSPDSAGKLGLIFSVVMILVSAVSVPFAYRPKQDYDAALAFVSRQAKPNDAIVSVGLAGYVYKNFYGADWTFVKTLDELEAVRVEANGTWIVYSFEQVIEAMQPEIMAMIQRECPSVREFPGSVPAGTLIVCFSKKHDRNAK